MTDEALDRELRTWRIGFPDPLTDPREYGGTLPDGREWYHGPWEPVWVSEPQSVASRAGWTVWANVSWALKHVGYWVRPYDMLADRRRWFWQSRARCGFPAGTPRSVVEDVIAAVHRRSVGSDVPDPSHSDATER